jgi:hypothetical protein
MTKSSTAQTDKQADGARTEADKAATNPDKEKSSHDAKSRVKAGSDEGAGGGAKQKQNH